MAAEVVVHEVVVHEVVVPDCEDPDAPFWLVRAEPPHRRGSGAYR